ncbi:MAG: hypothetical protein HFJ06_02330 [Lachnospiraceae bacterium]|nr:hypothetical protein [Lachnospiraceae bacterium]MCI9657610.1 hypothetical protein [Lachnospiraceae bacterium]
MDSGYRGESHAIISNVSNRTQAIKKGGRIGQLIITLKGFPFYIYFSPEENFILSICIL